MSESVFTFIIYFCFLYLGVSILTCTIWVIRDRNKLKKGQQSSYQSEGEVQSTGGNI